MAARTNGLITLAGPPRNTSGIVQLDAGGAKVATVALKLASELAVHKVFLRPFGPGVTELRLRLPRETPPGNYGGEFALGEQRSGIRVEVEAVLHLRVHPPFTRLSLLPGGITEFAISLENRGNVPFEVPVSSALDLDDQESQSLALGRALRARLEPGEKRIDRFFEEIREQHGGQAKLIVVAGAGPLAPASTREVHVRVEAPETMHPGHSYSGGWQLGDAAHVLEVQVTAAKPVIRKKEPQ